MNIERIHRKNQLRDVAISVGFGLTLAVLLVGGFIEYSNLEHLAESERLVAHTHRVIEDLEALLSTLKDAETGQRGYLLTEDEKYLQPYESALLRARNIVAHLEVLTADNAVQRERLAQLEQKVDERVEELHRTIVVMKSGDRAAALAMVRSDTGQAMMDDLRGSVALMERTERDLLQGRDANSRVSFRAVVVWNLLTVATGAMLVVVVFYLDQRTLRTRRRAEEALKDAARRKDEFLAMLAHELRGPLAPLSNMLQVLKREDCSGETLRQARGTMERQLGQMVRLVDDLIDVNRITRDKLQLRKDMVELAPILLQSVEVCRPMAESAKHELIVTLSPAPIFVDADPLRLSQVFANLLNNACKYTEEGGQIRLTAERQGGEVVVKIKDTGIGIPPDMLGGIFGLFTQVDTALERSRGGLGIGLSLAKRLVEMHGGSVEARSEGVGRGSEFVVRLPVLAEQPTAGRPTSTSPG
ncbi:MAG TPA: CHASE3 domain-containing protein [Candidatus Polarisedimenticolia bacterium]|nr:CHASE3 domain-containing protein [Candidatus Polarisedimenticolia bacterium]